MSWSHIAIDIWHDDQLRATVPFHHSYTWKLQPGIVESELRIIKSTDMRSTFWLVTFIKSTTLSEMGQLEGGDSLWFSQWSLLARCCNIRTFVWKIFKCQIQVTYNWSTTSFYHQIMSFTMHVRLLFGPCDLWPRSGWSPTHKNARMKPVKCSKHTFSVNHTGIPMSCQSIGENPCLIVNTCRNMVTPTF